MAGLNARNTSLLYKLNFIPQYWESLKSEVNVAEALEESWKKRIEFLDNVSLQNNVVLFLWNAYTSRYIYMSDKLKVLSGLEPDRYLAEDGMEYSLARIHPDHLAPMLQFNQLLINYVPDAQIADSRDISLCLNYLYRNGKDEYEQVLQRGIALEYDTNGKPALFLNIINYVGHIKKHDAVNASITTPNEVKLFSFNAEKNAIDPPKTISDQEKKIISFLAQGLDTKIIAEKLSITEQTVYTHRRNLIKKTECLDTTGVVAFAKLINLI